MVSTMVLTLISQWVLQFPLAYVLSMHTALGENGIWWAFPITNVVMAVLTVGVYAKGDWKRKRLVDPDSLKRGQLTTEIIAEEGVRA
jgi:Na+-driven multidrug efflux pump